MPLLYGEGRRAFYRLQEEILRHSEDLSILAWTHPAYDSGSEEELTGRRRQFETSTYREPLEAGVFADNPSSFQRPLIEHVNSTTSERIIYRISSNVPRSGWPQGRYDPPILTSRGIKVTLLTRDVGENRFWAWIFVSLQESASRNLDCGKSLLLCLKLRQVETVSNVPSDTPLVVRLQVR